MTGSGKQTRAVALALLMVVSVIGGSFAFGGVAAADGSADADIGRPEQPSDESPVNPASSTEVEGFTSSDSGEPSEESLGLSSAVRFTLQQSSPSDRIPVILIFETQPEDRLPLDQMTAAEAQRDMKSLAENSQGPTLEYLDKQAARGRASDVQPLYLRNAIAVKANEDVIKEVADSQRIERVILDSKVSALDDSGSVRSLSEFRSELNQSSNGTADPTGFQRVVESEPARGVEDIQADVVQDAGVTGEGVNVSVIDTGINNSHPALEGQVVLRKNFVNDATNVGDPNGHGTHVAGTVAGRTDAEQAVGVAPDANLFDARALDAQGSGNLSDIISAFEWSEQNNADVVSASLGVDPIADDQETRVGIDNGTSENVSFEVYSNATGLNNVSEEGFQPAYVFVAVNNATVTNSSSAVNRTAAVENLTVTLRNPSGNQTLGQNNAGFVYRDGTVPDGQLLFKFTPSTARQISNGSWSLEVTNGNTDADVDVDVQTVPVYPPDGTDQVSKAVNNLESTGTIPVVAAGNAGELGNRTLASPAAAKNAITVGANGRNLIDVVSFSSRGPVGFGDDVRSGVDLIAPGVDIVSAGSPQAYAGEEPYVSFTGTSMATPHVSGTIALLLDANETLSRSEVETALESTAQSPPAGANAAGAGALDAYAAVNTVTPETLTPNRSVDRGIELYAGIGNTSETNVFVDAQPNRDQVGDAGTAPDIEAAAVDAEDDDANFQIGLADDTAPNATFVTYIDADRNDSTGDGTQSGAEYRLNLTRTFTNGTYNASIEAFEFNESKGQYEATSIGAFVIDSAIRYRPQFLNYLVATDSRGINTTEFDWHVVSQDPDSTSSDRLPDTGQTDTEYGKIDAVGVAWNSTAGAPAGDEQLQFRLYNEDQNGALVANQTIETNATGVAQTTLRPLPSVNTQYVLEIESERGRIVRQFYYLSDADVDRGPRLDNVTVLYRGYETRPDSPVELNIPVYSVDNGTIVPYEGPASLRLEREQTIDDLSVTNGTLTHTIDPAASPVFGNETTFVDIEVALTSNYSDAALTYDGGLIDQEADVEVESDVIPEVQVTAPRTSTSVAFQTTEERPDSDEQFRSRTPSDVNSTYEVRWFTDRMVASLYRELPESTATKLAEARATEGKPRLTDADRNAIDAAMDNVSDQGIVIRSATGEIAPERRGVGQFDVTPPEDAELGYVLITPNEPEVANETVDVDTDGAVVFVDQRIDSVVRTRTAPDDDDRYDIDVDAEWDFQEIDDGVFVPNESIEVRVELDDRIADEPVTDTDVVLYTTGGDTVTVTTDSDGVAETSISAPDLNYRNADFSFQRQQVLGIASGLQTSEGRSVSDAATVTGFAFTRTQDAVRADPSLSYDESNQTLALDITYENSTSFNETNATESLVVVGTPSAPYNTQRDVFAGYVGDDTDNTTLSRMFDEPVRTNRSKQYRVRTRTAGGTLGYGYLSLGGIDTEIDAPEQVPAGQSRNVTVTVTNRTADPVVDATVVLHYTEGDSEGTVTAAGEALIGTTNSTGVATFTISPDLADEFDRGPIRLQAGYATDTVSEPRAETEFTTVVSDVNVAGTVSYNNGTAAAGENITAVGGNDDDIVRTTQTDSSGAFDLAVPQGIVYDLVFSQDEPVTDGVPDLYTFETTDSIGNSTDVGLTTLPAGNVTTVRVIDQNDVPVADSRVEIVSHGTQPFKSQRQGPVVLTDDEGQLDVTGNKVELANNVTITAVPPENSSVFVSEFNTTQRNITEDTSVNLTLVRDTAPPTVRVDLPETVKIGEQFVIDASNSSDTGTGIANYTFTFPNDEGVTQPGPRLEVTAPDLGVQNITVTVTDNAGRQNSTTVDVEVVDTAPVIVTPPERTYDPAHSTTIDTFHNATGVINSSDVAIRLVNVTDGNDEQVAVNDSVPLNGTVDTTIPAGTLSGNVTIQTQLYNNSSKQAVTNDTVELIAAPSDRLDTAPGIVAPPDADYDPTRPFTLGTGHNATGVIAAEDVAIRLVNVTAGNDTIVAVNDSVPLAGTANTTIPAGTLSGNVTIQTQLYNTSSQQVVATDTVVIIVEESDASPTAAYDFEGTGSTVVDRTGNGYTGELNGADRVPGRNGTVLSFDGSSHARLGSADTLNPRNESYSVSLWFKTDSVSGPNSVLFAKRGGDNERVKVALKNDGSDEGKVSVGFKDDPGLGNDGITSSETYTDGTWHRLLVVRDVETNSIELYVDGEQIGNTTDTQGDINPSGPAYLGAQPEYPNDRHYTGQLDDVTVYKQAVEPDATRPNESQDAAPFIVAPSNATYNPTQPFTIGTGHNAIGVINSSDVAIRLVNVTNGNDTVVAVNDSVPVEGDVNTTIPAGSLSGNVTIQTQLYNTSSQQVVANDTVGLTVIESSDDQDSAPFIVAPPDTTYDPTKPFTVGTSHDATTIDSSDVAIRLVNTTDGNNTVVAVNDSVPIEGDANTTIPAGSLSGNVTVAVQLINNTSQPEVVETDIVNLTAVRTAPTEPDNTEPQINSVKILNDSVAPGQNLVVEVNATDASDIIVSSVALETRRNLPFEFDGQSITLEKFDRAGLNQGSIRFEIPIAEDQANGTYILNRVRVTDAAGNRNFRFDSEGPSVVVSNPDVDPETNAPEVSEVNIVNESVEPGQQLAVDVNASDQSNITRIEVNLEETGASFDAFNEEIQLTANADTITQNGTTRLTTTVPESQVNGEYEVSFVEVSDEIGNERFLSQVDTVNVTGGIARLDREEPQVTDLTIPSTVSAGDNITVGLNVSDQSRVVSATIVLEKQNSFDIPFGLRDRAEIKLQRKDDRGLGGTIQLEATVPDDRFNGTYEIEELRVTDAALNTRDLDSFDIDQRSDLSAGPIELTDGANLLETDTTPPEISNVSAANESVEVGDQLVVTADISDESRFSSSGEYFFVSSLSGRTQGIEASPIALTPESDTLDNGTVTLSTTVPQNTVSGRYELGRIQATDTVGNEQRVFGFSPLTRVSVTGGIDPDTASQVEITDVEILNESVAPGESAQVRITTDRPTSFGFLSVEFSPVVKEPTPGLLPVSDFEDDNLVVTQKSETTLIATITVPESSPDGTIQLDFVGTEFTEASSEQIAGQSLRIRSDTAPDITAPDSTKYDPTRPFTIGTGHNATGVINSSDVAIRLVNVTDENDTVIAVNNYVPVAGDANTTIPAGTLSGNVTIETQLYNDSTKQVVATDTVSLTLADQDGEQPQPPASVALENQTVPNGSTTVTIESAQLGNQSVPGGEFVVVVHETTGGPYGNSIGAKIGESEVFSGGSQQNITVDLSKTLSSGDNISALTRSQSLVAMLHRANTSTTSSVAHGEPIIRNGTPVTGRARITVASGDSSQGTPNATLSATDAVGAPGDTVTVTFNLTNQGNERGFILNTSLNESAIQIINQSSDGPTWNANETKWLWQTVESNSSVTASLTVRLPESAPPGTEYTISAEALTADGVVSTTNTTVSTGLPVDEAIDTNNNGQIDDLEILQAIEYWRDDTAVPQTGGKTIGDFQILELIETWRLNREV